MTEILQGGKRDQVKQDATGSTDFSVTNRTRDYALDCTADVADLGDFLGTLVEELIRRGVLNGTVA